MSQPNPSINRFGKIMHIVLNRKCDLRNKTYKNMTPLPAPILTNVSSEQQQGEQIYWSANVYSKDMLRVH